MEPADELTSRGWKAWAAGSPARVELQGEVCTSATDDVALHLRDPQGVNPRILLVELTVEEVAAAKDGPTWRHAALTHPVGVPLSLDQVVVFYKDRIVADLGIVDGGIVNQSGASP